MNLPGVMITGSVMSEADGGYIDLQFEVGIGDDFPGTHRTFIRVNPGQLDRMIDDLNEFRVLSQKWRRDKTL